MTGQTGVVSRKAAEHAFCFEGEQVRVSPKHLSMRQIHTSPTFQNKQKKYQRQTSATSVIYVRPTKPVLTWPSALLRHIAVINDPIITETVMKATTN